MNGGSGMENEDRLEKLGVADWFVPQKVKDLIGSITEPERWLLNSKVNTYNELPASAPDGTGIECEVCRNKGSVAVIDEEGGPGRMVIRPCTCRSRRMTALRLKRCGMLERAKTCTFDSFRTENALQTRMKEMAQGWLDAEPDQWLAFCGQSGAGKTHLCTAAFVQAVARRQIVGEYMLWGPAVREIKGGLYEDGPDLLERYANAPLLYVDDLFKGRSDAPLSDTDLRLAFELLDHRYNRDLPTILSTERTFPQLAAVDEAIAGRIRERCGGYIVNIAPGAGKNYRFRQ